MNTNAYQLYVEQCLQLAETLVIKSQPAAEALNTYLVETGISQVDELDQTTWKYYMNLAGEYHPSDTVMTVISMDTTEEIIFSKENLKKHRATARGYAYGTRAHDDLVARYPDQRYLIRGILYPVDINAAIAADNGDILGYPPGYIEENEYSLVAKLETYAKGYIGRYVNEAFSNSDGLYTAAWMGQMHMHMILAILTCRLEACHTNEAHSYHVSQYLASHGRLDRYMDQLTTKQALWVYRNIRYIRNNTGKQENFEWLIEHIMTERKLPLAEFTMRHDLTKLEEQAKPEVAPMAMTAAVTSASTTTEDKVFYPTIKFAKKPKNLGYNVTGDDPITLEQILTKEDTFAKNNVEFRQLLMPEIQSAMENSLSNVVQTKFLESSMIDRSNNTPYTMADILLNNWLVLAVRGNYRAYIGVNDPKTGDRISLQVKDAFIFAWYSFCWARGIQIDTIPNVVATRVPIDPLPSVDQLMSVVSSKYITPNMASDVLSVMPVVGDLISTEAFYNLCLETFDAAQYQRRYIASQEHFKRRGMMLNMVSRIYTDALCELIPEASNGYKEWFAARNIDVSGWSVDDHDLFYLSVVKEATGLNLVTTKSLKDLQSSMVRMLSQLSSYSIQINADINSTDIRMSDWGMIRLGDVKARMKDEAYLEINTGVKDIASRNKGQINFDVTKTTLGADPSVRQRTRFRYDVTARPRAGKRSDYLRVKMYAAPVKIRAIPKPVKNDLGITPVLGTDLYLQLDPAVRVNFVDVYSERFLATTPVVVDPSGLPPLSTIITVTVLNGLVYGFDGSIPQKDLAPVMLGTWLDGFDKS